MYEDLCRQHTIPEYFSEAVICYIDFLLSIKSLAELSPELIFAGCVIVAYETTIQRPPGFQGVLNKLKANITGSKEVAIEIKKKFHHILYV